MAIAFVLKIIRAHFMIERVIVTLGENNRLSDSMFEPVANFLAFGDRACLSSDTVAQE